MCCFFLFVPTLLLACYTILPCCPLSAMPQEEELSELGRGVMLYRRLGLEFEGGDVGDDGSMRCLRLVFRQVCDVFAFLLERKIMIPLHSPTDAVSLPGQLWILPVAIISGRWQCIRAVLRLFSVCCNTKQPFALLTYTRTGSCSGFRVGGWAALPHRVWNAHTFSCPRWWKFVSFMF